MQNVTKPGLRERWSQWRLRHPRALARLFWFAIAGLVVVVAALAVYSYFQGTRQEAENVFQNGREQVQRLQFVLGINTLTEARRIAESLPGNRDLVEKINEQLRLAHRGLRVQKLHNAVVVLHFVSVPESLPRGDQQALDSECNDVWQGRSLLLSPSTAEVLPHLTQDIRLALQDLGILWSDLRIRLAPNEQKNKARREALEILAELEKHFGASVVLDHEQLIQARALGLQETVGRLEKQLKARRPESFWDHFGLGRCLLRAGKLEEAARQLEKAMELEPRQVMPHFLLGVCHYRKKHFKEAIAEFRSCVGQFPQVYFFRGLAHAALGNFPEAEKDFDQAVKLDPNHAPAYFQRGLVSYQQNKLSRSAEDLQRALEKGGDAAAIHFQLALIHLVQEEWQEAVASLREVIRQQPDHAEALKLLDQLPR